MTIDRVSPVARMCRRRAVVRHSPGWTVELLGLFVLALGIALLVTMGQLAVAMTETRAAEGEAEFWREFALAPDTRPRVVLDHDGKRFRCSQFHIQREWELAVAAECEVLGGLLEMAKYSGSK
jgi:hypothetical protein